MNRIYVQTKSDRVKVPRRRIVKAAVLGISFGIIIVGVMARIVVSYDIDMTSKAEAKEVQPALYANN